MDMYEREISIEGWMFLGMFRDLKKARYDSEAAMKIISAVFNKHLGYPFERSSTPCYQHPEEEHLKEYVEGMWTEENPYNAKFPRLYFDDFGGNKNTRPNSYFLQNASYFRLKNLTFGYTLPKQWTDKVKMSRVRIYFSGDNLVTFTKFYGLDPERETDGRAAQYPQNKICSFGVNVEF